MRGSKLAAELKRLVEMRISPRALEWLRRWISTEVDVKELVEKTDC